MSLFPPNVEYALVGVPRGKNSQIFVVDALNGNDADSGTKWQAPLLTPMAAYGKMTTLHNDVMLLVGAGTEYATLAQFVWDKSFAHIIGLSTPNLWSPRSRIHPPVLMTTTPFVDFSASGCTIKNVSFWHEAAAAGLVDVHLTGSHNYFEGCQFAGGIGANALTGMRSLHIDGGDNNTFRHCIVGNATVMAPNGGACLEFGDASGGDSGAEQNTFEDCKFVVETNGTTFVHVLVPAAADVGRLNTFTHCLFCNTGSGAQASVFGIVAALSPSSRIIGRDNWMYKVAEWCATNNGYVSDMTIAANTTGVDGGNLLMITS
jgi:hypothetical protein